MIPARPDPKAPKDPVELPLYWDERRMREGRIDTSRCAAELRVALAADSRRFNLSSLLMLVVAGWITIWAGCRIFATRADEQLRPEPPAVMHCVCPEPFGDER